ncbi:MAG: CPBP family intramembrane metalloprotease [Clostridiales bacterium]|nr:CPBP family intramembrane metalloprotease [Clostridiales bacterium]
MVLFLEKTINSIMQIILFSLIPFIWWLITARKDISFLQWIGLKPVSDGKKSKIAIWTIGISAAFILVSVVMLYLIRNVETATSVFRGVGMKAIPAIIVYAVFNTSLPEEILFRGFLLKRFSNWFGFVMGNVIQSILFGLLHGVMFFSLVGTVQTILIILFTGGIAWCMGVINEKKANGSIIPSWCIHAISNVFSGIFSAFMLF